MQEVVSFEAATAVLETTEMLENIMRFLDMKTLLLSQRVDKRWQATIKGSIMLQKKLFMLPATLGDVFELEMMGSRQDSQSLVLPDTRRKAVTSNYSSRYSVVNPLLFDSSKNENRPMFRHSLESTAAEGSWRDMQIGQPPLSGFFWLYKNQRVSGEMIFKEERLALDMQISRGLIVAELERQQWKVRDGVFYLWALGDQCLTKKQFMKMVEDERKKERKDRNEAFVSAVKQGRSKRF